MAEDIQELANVGFGGIESLPYYLYCGEVHENSF